MLLKQNLTDYKMKYALFVHVDFLLDHSTNNGISLQEGREKKRSCILGVKVA